MKIICVSASNVEQARPNSASTHTCELIREILLAKPSLHAEVEIVPLVDYGLTPCNMCGKCFETGRCNDDKQFNLIFEKLIGADGLFFVVPHYATIPSKLVMLLEKLEEIMYLKTYDDPDYRSPLYKKPVGIIAHGGQTEEAISYYKSALLDPMATALTSVQMQVVGASEKWPYGVAFGVKNISKRPDSIFVEIEHDWSSIQERIRPLVANVVQKIAA